jgi:hypothetical protein
LHISVAAYNIRWLKATSNLNWKDMAGGFTFNKTVTFQSYSKRLVFLSELFSLKH